MEGPQGALCYTFGMETFLDFMTSLPSSFWAIFGVVVGGLVTLGTSWSIKNLEYRNAFYTKLIDKRMSIYDELSDALFPFFEGIGYKKHGVQIPKVLSSRNEFGVAYFNIQKLKHKMGWFDENTSDNYAGFCKFLNKINSIFVHFEEDPIENEKLLIAASEPLLEWVYLLQANLQNDILNLHKTPKFRATHFVPSLPGLEKLGPEFWLKGIEIPQAILKNEEEQLPPE